MTTIHKTSRALVFDLDGVILDTYHIHLKGWKKVAEKFGADIRKANFDNLKGQPTKAALEILRRDLSIPVDIFDIEVALEIKNHVRDHEIKQLTDKSINYDIMNIIKSYKKSALIICFATTTRTIEIVERLNIKHLFDDFYCGNMIREPKKNCIEAFLQYIFLKYEIKPTNIIAFDDSHEISKKFLTYGVMSICMCNQNECGLSFNANALNQLERFFAI